MSDRINAFQKWGPVITPSAAAIEPQPRGLYCSASGSVTVEYEDGSSETVDLTAGYHPCEGIRAVTAATATVHAYYGRAVV